jgi:hypothetical protein
MYFINKYLSLVVVLTTFLLTTSAFAMDTGFTEMPQEVRGLVVRQAAYEQLLDNKAPVTLKKTLGNLERPAILVLALKGFEETIKSVTSRKDKVHVIAYADDFVITGATKAVLENEIMPVVVAFLKERGLELSTEKTKITHVDDVCKEWQPFIEDELKVGAPIWKARYGVTPENEHIYQQFLNGVLIYRPNPQSDEGMVELKISDLPNPLEGTFDLSGCGDTGKYLSISTGYRKETISENSDKLEIQLAPRLMIEKNLGSSAGHFLPIMDNWNEETAPIGIFWSWGGGSNLSRYDFLTTMRTHEISSKNLYETSLHAVPTDLRLDVPTWHSMECARRLHVRL